MILLVLLTPAAVLGLFWAMQRMEIWMSRWPRPARGTRTPLAACGPCAGAVRGPAA